MTEEGLTTSTSPHGVSLRRWIAAGLALALAIALSACGSSSSSRSAKTLLDRVQGHELRMAVFAGPPQSFQAADGSWTGHDVDILLGFAKTIDAKPVFKPLPFDTTLEAVQSRRADITMGIAWNEERAKALDFSRPTGNFLDGVAVRASDPLATDPSFEGLKGKKIGVLAGTIWVDEAKDVDGAKMVKFSGEPDLLAALKQGRVDAVFYSVVGISTWSADPAKDVKMLGPAPLKNPPPIELQRAYFAVEKGEYSASFLKKFNEYLKKITCDGTLKEIMAKYDVTDPAFFEGLCEASDVPGLAK